MFLFTLCVTSYGFRCFFFIAVIENSHCKKVYGTMYNIPINKYHLCAGPITEGGSGTCIVSWCSSNYTTSAMLFFLGWTLFSWDILAKLIHTIYFIHDIYLKRGIPEDHLVAWALTGDGTWPGSRASAAGMLTVVSIPFFIHFHFSCNQYFYYIKLLLKQLLLFHAGVQNLGSPMYLQE